jgi:maltooligosyltrehalose trehalohydrolase
MRKDAAITAPGEVPDNRGIASQPTGQPSNANDYDRGIARRPPTGAEIVPGGKGVHFRAWAPATQRIELVIEGGPGVGRTVAMKPERDGYAALLLVSDADDVTRSRSSLDGNDALPPDPASRFQPEGPHGPSEVIDPLRFPWTDRDWRGRPIEGQVFYEMHVGTFTPEGTWEAAARELPELASLGITATEMTPVADFPGASRWGYDGGAAP